MDLKLKRSLSRLFGFLTMGRKAQGDWIPKIVGLLLILVLGSSVLGIDLKQFSPFAGAAVPAGGAAGAIALPADFCPNVEDTTVTLDAVRKFSTGTALAGRHYYRLKDGGAYGAWSNIADAATLTASPGDSLQVAFVLSGGTVASGHYAVVKEYTVPCKGAWTITEEVYQSGTPTIRIYSEDNGNLLDAGGDENETLQAGDVVNLKWEVQNAFETGNPHGFVIVATYNRLKFDDIVLNMDGKKLESVGVPVRTPGTINGTFSQKGFLLPGNTDGQVHSGSIVVDTDDSVNPGTCEGGTADSCAINFTWISRNYFLTDDDQILLGAEDSDDNNRTGQSDLTGSDSGSFYTD